MFSSGINQQVNTSPQLRTARGKCSQLSTGFEFPIDEEEALFSIWETFKNTLYVACPTALYQDRCRAVKLMMECHRVLKLPLQTLYLSILIFDKVLFTNYQLNGDRLGQNIELNILGVACLYSCQKLQKIRNYGVSYWLKHISGEFLASFGFTGINFSAEQLKRYEAHIMESMNYNLFSSTVFDILLGIWTLKPPTELEFYFCQYLLELSLFVDYRATKNQKIFGSGTASSVNQMTQKIEPQQNSKLHTVEIALAIVSLGCHFSGKDSSIIEQLVKKIWKFDESQQNRKRYELKLRSIDIKANILFQKVCKPSTDPNVKQINTKYGKSVNMGVSNLKFYSKSPHQQRDSEKELRLSLSEAI